jgi:hypothetical protein
MKPDESIENYDFALFYVGVKVVFQFNGREWRKVHNDELHCL